MRFKSGLLVSLLFLASCEPIVNSRGNVIAIKQIDNFVIGKTTMEDVLKSCGTPSLHKNNFTWIYIGGHSKEVAFNSVEIKDRSVVKLIFNEDRTLKDKIVTRPTKEDFHFDEEVTNLISNAEVKALLKKGHE